MKKLIGTLSLLILAAGTPAFAQPSWTQETREMDALLMKAFQQDQPGAAAIVVRKGQALLRKGYGVADLELNIPIEPDMVFRLGSVTKQFTATAILMLQEQGKLSVGDPITKYIPDYPTQGHTITIEHLLTHTSGIKSYTSMPEWQPLWRKDFKLNELIDFFRNQPMDFAPGERWLYDNSGYILLGAIIEKASGQTYEEFLRKHIFEPLGMKHSYYDHTEQIIPRRVKGYQRTGQGGFENAPYLSMTQPYAAGSLASSVDDLVLWNAAVRDNRLVKRETMAKAHTPYVLKDGRSTAYGYGWTVAQYEGHRTVEHSGGIHGFASYVLSLPDDDIFVAILTNGSAGPGTTPGGLALQLAGIAVGKPAADPAAIVLKPEQLERLVGTYVREDSKTEANIVREGDQLFIQIGGSRNPIRPISESEFFIPQAFTRLVFASDAGGRIKSVQIRPRAGMVQNAIRSEKVVPERKEVAVDLRILQQYTGIYELAPSFTLTVTVEEGKLMSQATGQQKVQLYAESETKGSRKNNFTFWCRLPRITSGGVSGIGS